jgi:hypothetical protein
VARLWWQWQWCRACFQDGLITFREDSPLLIAKVIYASEEERIEWLRAKFVEAVAVLKTHPIPDDKLHIVACQIFTLMLIYSLISKHHGFSEENEWRIIYLPERFSQAAFTMSSDHTALSQS